MLVDIEKVVTHNISDNGWVKSELPIVYDVYRHEMFHKSEVQLQSWIWGGFNGVKVKGVVHLP